MRQRLSPALAGCLALLAAFTLSCTTTPTGLAHATVVAKSGSTVSGTATFGARGDSVVVLLDISGATTGMHGVHIHQVGDCSAVDGSSAGAHFNPFSAAHGSPAAAQHHAGDLGNILVRNNGTGHLEISSPLLTMSSGAGAIVNRAIVIHAVQDDFTTQPTGNSGGRVGCGVIRLD